MDKQLRFDVVVEKARDFWHFRVGNGPLVMCNTRAAAETLIGHRVMCEAEIVLGATRADQADLETPGGAISR